MKKLQDLDVSNMRELVENFPFMLRSLEPSRSVSDSVKDIRENGFEGVLLVGMGGSSISGATCKGILTTASKPVLVHQDYGLPEFVDESWAIIATSYSGNTAETLSACREGSERNCPTIGITSGGKLGEMLPRDSVQILPDGFPPRAAFPMIISVLLPLLERLMGFSSSDLTSIARNLEALSKNWEMLEMTPRMLAEKLLGRVPLFVGWRHLSPVAYRAKCQVNENSKTIAYTTEMPEANHNEIEACGSYGNYGIVPVFLRSGTESETISKSFDATSRMLSEVGSPAVELNMKTKDILEEVLSYVFFLDVASVELAGLRGVDAVAVARISQLKRLLGT
ncbi:MAG: bifunctional phosphoglucose/phosphomannose isomerase [Candidatus Thorarchaeota archaeon]|nr:bifunctional phosphoglucose/phosphomannose isomerase [Candidatus Thorarchaeota archaeon]